MVEAESSLFGGSPARPTERPAAEPAQWLDADAPSNPFDVPILDLKVTQILVGADIEARTNRGFAPLHIAGALGHLDAAKALVSRGADPGAVSTDGKAM